MKRFGTYIGAICVACLVSAPFGGTAYAADIAQLDANYQMAVQAYEEAVVERQQNADEIALVEASIEHTEALLTDTRNRLGATAVSLYKESCGHNSLIELLFTSSSFS